LSRRSNRNKNMLTAAELFDRLKHVKVGGNTCVFSMKKCEEFIPKIHRIEALKKENNAVVLAHSYVSPEILFSVADKVGDSYELSKYAKKTSAQTIVFAAVKFMGETAKILNPGKTVVTPSSFNGCSLADSITGSQVETLRRQYPDYTFVCYINTTAEVKAQCDVCVTSSNVYKIIENIPNSKIYFLPDRLMGKNIENEAKKRGLEKTIKYWDGVCYVHEEYDPDMVRFFRSEYPGIKIVSHPECHEEVVKSSDFVGSTSQMVNYVEKSTASTFFLLTECGLADRIGLDGQGKKLVGTCTMCKYMKSNTLDNILEALESPPAETIIEISGPVQEKAQNCIDNMFTYAEKKQPITEPI
jgi:quinolinate synthase